VRQVNRRRLFYNILDIWQNIEELLGYGET